MATKTRVSGGSKDQKSVTTTARKKSPTTTKKPPVKRKARKPVKPLANPKLPTYFYESGRPMKFQSLEDLQQLILAYFEDCAPHWIDEKQYIDQKDDHGKPVIIDGVVQQDLVVRKVKTKQKPLTVTGLAVALGTYRDVLIDYEKTYADKLPEFSNAIKDAKEQVKEFAESSLFGSNATGPIFNLKNNWGFKDKYETENVNKEVTFVNTVPRPKK